MFTNTWLTGYSLSALLTPGPEFHWVLPHSRWVAFKGQFLLNLFSVEGNSNGLPV